MATNTSKMTKAQLIARINELEQAQYLTCTNIQVFPFKVQPENARIMGLATVVLNDQLVMRGLRIMKGENGLFLSYPLNDPSFKEDFRTLYNPITRQLREHIEFAVLSKYNECVAEMD